MNNQFRICALDITGKPCHVSFFNSRVDACKKAKELAIIENRTYYVHENIDAYWWSIFAIDAKGKFF